MPLSLSPPLYCACDHTGVLAAATAWSRRPSRTPPQPTRASASPQSVLRAQAFAAAHSALQVSHSHLAGAGMALPPTRTAPPRLAKPLAPRARPTLPGPRWTGGPSAPTSDHSAGRGPGQSRADAWPAGLATPRRPGYFAKRPLAFVLFNPRSAAFQK